MNLATAVGIVLSLCLAAAPVLADQTVPEKAKVVKNDAVRGTKKTVNRVKEAVCLKSDAECLARKAKHRVQEGADATVDKVDEVKDKVDGK